jgi:2-polyprenyl-6-hydroxyphenyl methylase/3-demethylubiquinone-9 3-methyltransferase
MRETILNDTRHPCREQVLPAAARPPWVAVPPRDDGLIGHRYDHGDHSHAHAYLLPRLDRILSELQPRTIFEVGCGNGSIARHLSRRYRVAGIDPSPSGIRQSLEASHEVELHLGSGYDDLRARYGQFDCVLSVEVIEHIYHPRLFMRRVFDLVTPGGQVVLSTPYHGYLKNLALAFSGQMDQHFTALWDGGHIKFWSVKTLGLLLEEAGFENVRFEFAGRFYPLAKSMIAIARRPVGTDS